MAGSEPIEGKGELPAGRRPTLDRPGRRRCAGTGDRAGRARRAASRGGQHHHRGAGPGGGPTHAGARPGGRGRRVPGRSPIRAPPLGCSRAHDQQPHAWLKRGGCRHRRGHRLSALGGMADCFTFLVDGAPKLIVFFLGPSRAESGADEPEWSGPDTTRRFAVDSGLLNSGDSSHQLRTRAAVQTARLDAWRHCPAS